MPNWFRTTLLHVGISLALWFGLNAAFGYLVRWEVDREYRLGYRTTTDGDSIGIPIAGFAILLGSVIIAVNFLIVLLRLVRRHKQRLAA